MLTAFKLFLKNLLVPILYAGGLLACLYSIFKNAEIGFYLLVALIPQPNIWYKFHDFPFGNNIIDILFASVLIGILRQKKTVSSPNLAIIIALIIVNYFSVWNSSLRFDLPAPVTGASFHLMEWKNYAEMALLYYLAFNITDKEDAQKLVMTVITFSILLLSVRSYRNFSEGSGFNYDRRVGGPFETVGLGPNHFGAFIAYYSSVIAGLAFYEKNARKKLLYYATILFSMHPLFFAYSRGAYLAALASTFFFGLVKKRILLAVLLVLFLSWQVVLPRTVVERIAMTENESGEIESSAAQRLDLWDHAMGLFKENPLFGIGFGGFGHTVEEGELTDTHNFYLRTLSEQGLIGIFLYLIILFRALHSGIKLWRKSLSPFQKGLGLGFAGCVFAVMAANLFGDRWSYFVLGGYFWIIWGLVDRALVTIQNPAPVESAGIS